MCFFFSFPSPLVLSSGRTLTFLFFSSAWAWPLSWELAQLDPLFSFPLLANFPDNWSRMQTEREKGGLRLTQRLDSPSLPFVMAVLTLQASLLDLLAPPPLALPASLTRTGFIICDKVPMLWEESALDVYYIRSVRTNGETPPDHVIATGQQGSGYKTALLLSPLFLSFSLSLSLSLSPSFPLFSFTQTKNIHPHRKGHTRLESLLRFSAYAIYLTLRNFESK